MTRKRFIKMMMALGLSRNQANGLALLVKAQNIKKSAPAATGAEKK